MAKPNGFLQFNTSEASKQQEVSKIGYGLDDSRLGGPFKADPTIVLQQQRKTNNIGVETKDFYTGKGWEVSENQKKVTFKNKNDVVSWYEQNTKQRQLRQQSPCKKVSAPYLSSRINIS